MINFLDFKALIVDFDGTLVDANFNLPPKVKETIMKLISRGYIFSIATGRPYQGIVKKVCQSLNLGVPLVVSGGAEIIDPEIDRLLWHEYIPPESAKKIIKSFLDENLQFAVESKGCVFTSAARVIKECGSGISFKDLGQLDYNSVSGIVLDEVNIEDLAEEEEKLMSLYPELHIIRGGMSKAPVLDITSAKATKHLAVLELSKILNISPELMIGVGDGYNDYPLLSVCGLKVAMANAPKELKSIADIILPDVAHDGLMDLLNKL